MLVLKLFNDHRFRFFDMGLLKRFLPTALLAYTDSLLQRSNFLYTPSVFAHTVAREHSVNNLDVATIFACPETGEPLTRSGDTMTCAKSGKRWAIRDGIYDFKAPL